MKVDSISTLRLEKFPNVLFLELHTDEGLTGLGETYFGAAAVEAYVRETIAPYLLGKDPLDIERHRRALKGYLGYDGAGVETRGNSALDIALWDLLGQVRGAPLYTLLGGRVHERLPIYNTCAGYGYARQGPQVAVDNWGLGERPEGRYEDLRAFLERPGELALSLLEEGVTGMKIWPFDIAARRTNGAYISKDELEGILGTFAAIRDAAGTSIDVMVELHGLWELPAAREIVRAVDEFRPFWYEDPVKADDLGALAEVARATDVPIAAGETLAGTSTFRRLIEARAAGVVIFDVGWCGGLSEAKRIATVAEASHLPVAAHDCTGPVVLTASTHLAAALPNAFTQETVRAFYHGWYGEIVTELPAISDGHIAPPEGPGLGTKLLPDLGRRDDASQRVTRVPDL